MAAVSGHLWEIEDTDFVVEQVRNLVLHLKIWSKENHFLAYFLSHHAIEHDHLPRQARDKREETAAEENGRVI